MHTSSPAGEPPREPSEEEIARGLAQLEELVRAVQPEPPAVVEHVEPENDDPPTEDEFEDDESAAPLVPLPDGETKRVRALRAEVAEAHRLLALQDDEAPLLIDTPKVRKHLKRASEAARLHAVVQDPTMRAYRALRTRRRLVALAMVALALALGWSTAGVQAFASEGADPWSPRWVFAWLVEPFMSIALYVVVGARTYLATLGQPVESRTLTRVERLFLILTLGMNAWPYLPWSLPKGTEFSFSYLVLHVLGPIVAVAIVIALPIILEAFNSLDHGLAGTGGTRGAYRANAPGRYTPSTPAARPDPETLAVKIKALIQAGALPPGPGVQKIAKALRASGIRVGTDTARDVQKLLAAGPSSDPDEESR
ncbi:hypothetical protein ABZ912_20165 [Nonomuraea angiospora]|uniref:hypothetical protein n=1 Tax=Nonomuraea angiospora TaxID=46172 RepID=UPI0033F0CDC6